MAPQVGKKYSAVESSEELGMISDASHHTAATVIDVEICPSSSQSSDSFASPCTSLTNYLRSYRPVELLFCLGFFLATNVASGWLRFTPYQRPIPVQYLESSGEYVVNLTHDEHFDHETVPYNLLILLSGVSPLLLQVLLSLCRRRSCPLREVHATLCVYFVAWSFNMIACEFVKNYVGYLRPLFFEACEPNNDYSECTGHAGDTIRKSFVSGHSSTAFCGMTLLALYLHSRFGMHSKRCYREIVAAKGSATQGRMLKVSYDEQDGSLPLARLVSVLALIPLGIALWIAASRVRDNKHFPADVVGGAVIGASLAGYSHGLWFV